MPYEDYFKSCKPNSPLEEKIAIIKQNNKKAFNMEKEIASWSKEPIQITEIKEISPKSAKAPILKIEIADDTKNIYNKISLLEINDLTEEEILSKLKEIIGQFSYIVINQIKLLLYKEGIIYKRMILDSSNEEEIKELNKAIAAIQLKIELLDELEELEEEQEVEEAITNNNNLFFLLSDTGKVIALESLRKNVPREYYSAFKELLLGLKVGNAKNLKRLRRYNFLQVKDFKIRIIFEKLSNGNYVILDCFMKKVDTGISYRNNLANRLKEYQKNKDNFLNKYLDEDFIKEHESYLAEILNILDNKTLEGVANETRII